MKQMKTMLLLTCVLILPGCGAIDRFFASITGDGTPTCWEGVMYVQFTSGASVAYNKNGTIMNCGE